jgi:release factor glutamine methyltransferase
MTLLEVLRSTTDYLAKHQIENPRLNAELLLVHSLGRKRIELYLGFEEPLTEAQLIPIRDLVRRRGQGEPLQHLVGTVEFLGREFVCDKRALVPRPETEELVELVKRKMENRMSSGNAGEGASGLSFLDVGTGSGVIALSLAAEFPEAKIFAIDVSEEALSLARENAERLGLAKRIQFVRGDFANGNLGSFDLVVANLPYVGRRDQASLSREVRHDPEVALFGGEIGDELVRSLISEAIRLLRPGGLLALEIGLGQSAALDELLKAKNYHDIESKNDYSGIVRFLFARYG